MTDEVVIRELVGLDEILTIYPLFQLESSISEALFRERIEVIIKQGNYRCIAAFAGDRMVGVSGFWSGMLLWCGRFVEPEHVVVEPTLRSQGIGAKLLAWIEAEAMRLGYDVAMVAMILGKDRTRDFYRRNGYADDGLILVKTLSSWAAEAYPEYEAHKRAVAAG
jgi:GNAT superfamily N-acetyltransferase